MVYLSGADRPAFVAAVTATARELHAADGSARAQQDATLYLAGANCDSLHQRLDEPRVYLAGNCNPAVRELTGRELQSAPGGIGLLASYGMWRARFSRHGVPLRFDSEAYRARRGTYRRRFDGYCAAIDEHDPDSSASLTYMILDSRVSGRRHCSRPS